ncbi:calpain-C-like [Tropilaelaps mercedesae]|uniref:Calpain-C-like n=1 Tax=Tropilaelaps mercedesae TaxID=418985 RepID=A0A1V9XQN1_9ACAR|nr:calpain-C-like [Tropilaelaps mercedesae]
MTFLSRKSSSGSSMTTILNQSRTGTIRASVVTPRSASPAACTRRSPGRRERVYCSRIGQNQQAVFMSDFERVRKSLERGRLYEDPEFPAVQSTVFYHQTPPFQFVWKRPHVSVREMGRRGAVLDGGKLYGTGVGYRAGVEIARGEMCTIYPRK